MKDNREIHHRRSIRLKGYNYSQPGADFISLCTYQRQCWFGEIYQAQMHLNQIGKIVEQEWLKSAQMRPNLKLDEWIIMPNHLHGIVWIVQCCNNNSIPIWQRNYYESIIRDEKGLNQIRESIQNNPLSWGEDIDNSKSNSN